MLNTVFIDKMVANSKKKSLQKKVTRNTRKS